MAPMIETHATVSCYCGLNAYPLTLLTPSNPYPITLCHCSICRHQSGGLFLASIPCSPPPDSALANLTGYRTSESITRLFCTKCGSKMHTRLSPSDEWDVCVGVLQDHGELQLVIGAHEYVEGTGDGGMSDFLPKSNGKVLVRWAGPSQTEGRALLPHETEKSEQLPPGWTSRKASTAPRTDDERLLGKCHCGGVEFYITRPNEASKTAIPPGWDETFHGPYPTTVTSDPKNETWWLRPVGQDVRTRYLAGICVCDTCTRGLGFWFPAWAYVPLCNIVHADGTQVDLNNLGTLKSSRRTDSEPGVHRDFCGKCGASVFLWKESRGPIIDVAVGVLRAENAARAEDWLEWQTSVVMRKNEGKEKELIEELEEGQKAYKPTAGI